MKGRSLRRLAVVSIGVGAVLVTAVPASAAGSPSPYFAGYAAGPAPTKPPARDQVEFKVPAITCTGPVATPKSILAGDAVIDYPVTGAYGATWGGIVLSCPTATYTAEGFQWSPAFGLTNVTLFSAAPNDTVVVTTTLNTVNVDDLTSGKNVTTTFPTSTGAGQADIGIFCPADWYPSLGPCTGSPTFGKVSFKMATVNGLPLGTYAPALAASYLVGPGFTIKVSPLKKLSNFTDTFH